MPSTAIARRRTTGAALGVLLAAGLLSGSPLTTSRTPDLQAVVTYAGTAVDLPGVHLVARMPGLQLAVVRGDRGALTRLAAVPGVTGIAPDDAVQLAGHDDASAETGVLASAGLGPAAGEPGAGAGVRVALLDTGVKDTAALNRASGRLLDAADTSGAEPTGGPLVDGFGHGTFMAGLIAGGPVEGTDGEALGVAPGASVLVVRVARPDGSTRLSSVLGGLEWVYDHPGDVDVANLSFAHERPSGAYGADPLTVAVERVVQAGGHRRGRLGQHCRPGRRSRLRPPRPHRRCGQPGDPPGGGVERLGSRRPGVQARCRRERCRCAGPAAGRLGALPHTRHLAPGERADPRLGDESGDGDRQWYGCAAARRAPGRLPGPGQGLAAVLGPTPARSAGRRRAAAAADSVVRRRRRSGADGRSRSERRDGLPGVLLVGVLLVGVELVRELLVGIELVGVELVGVELVGVELVGVELVRELLVGVLLVGK